MSDEAKVMLEERPAKTKEAKVIDPILIQSKMWLNVEEVAVYLNVSVHTVREWCQSGEIPFNRIRSKLLRFNRERINRWIEEGR